jgi:hypothetical protein
MLYVLDVDIPIEYTVCWDHSHKCWYSRYEPSTGRQHSWIRRSRNVSDRLIYTFPAHSPVAKQWSPWKLSERRQALNILKQLLSTSSVLTHIKQKCSEWNEKINERFTIAGTPKELDASCNSILHSGELKAMQSRIQLLLSCTL